MWKYASSGDILTKCETIVISWGVSFSDHFLYMMADFETLDGTILVARD